MADRATNPTKQTEKSLIFSERKDLEVLAGSLESTVKAYRDAMTSPCLNEKQKAEIGDRLLRARRILKEIVE